MKNINFCGEQVNLAPMLNHQLCKMHEVEQIPEPSCNLKEPPLSHQLTEWADLPGDLMGKILPKSAANIRKTCRNWRDCTDLHLRQLRPNKRIKTEQLGQIALQFPHLIELNLSASTAIFACDLKYLSSLIYLRSLNLANYWTADGRELLALRTFKHLTELDLSNWKFDESADLLEMQNMTQLRTLILKQTRGIGERTLVGMASLYALVSLDLADCKQTQTGELALLSSLKNLTRLNLTRCRGNDATLIALSSLRKLSELNLTGFSNFSERGLICLRNLQFLRHAIFSECKEISLCSLRDGLAGKTLAVLDLRGCELLCGESYKLIGKITTLCSLTLSHSSSMNDENCRSLAPLIELKSLDLSSTLITEKSFAQLKCWSKLQSLSLNHCCMLRFDQLTQLKPLNRLHSLNASMRRSSSADALWALTHICELNTLKLWGNCTVSDREIKALTTLSQLKHLQLANFPQVTEGGLNDLLRSQQLESLRCMEFGHIGEESRERLNRRRKSIEIEFQ